MRVLTWNLYHGRALPPAGHALLGAFARRLAAEPWDVALLQEVPPWWPAPLGRACGASARMAPTSRNALLPARRALAVRTPDLIKANGGGANAILVRGRAITAHERVTLRSWPERRVAHAVRLADGSWWGNLHAQVHSDTRARADLDRAAAAAQAWAGPDAPLLLGGDTNVRDPRAAGLVVLGGHDVDFLLARGWHAAGPVRALAHAPLSDHAPVACDLVRDVP